MGRGGQGWGARSRLHTVGTKAFSEVGGHRALAREGGEQVVSAQAPLLQYAVDAGCWGAF